MATLTSRQGHILSKVSELGRPNVNDLVHHGESPTRLKANLEQLIHKHCLHMDHDANRKRYTITKTGLRQLAKHEVRTMENSHRILINLNQIDEELVAKAVQATGKGWMYTLDVDRDLPNLNIPRTQSIDDELLKGTIKPSRANRTGGPIVLTRSRVLAARKRET